MHDEIHDLDEFDEHLRRHGDLVDAVVQGLDLRDREDALLTLRCPGTVFLGTRLTDRALGHVITSGAVVFPHLADLPFKPYRPTLYGHGELLEGWQPGGDFANALDSRIYRWSSAHPAGSNLPVMHALSRRLHDLAIDDALRDHLEHHPDVVAVMGGHQLRRGEPAFRIVADLGRGMARAGWHVATGGGPGAMEAANLGAWMCNYSDDDLAQAIEILSAETDYRNDDAYLTAGQRVLDRYPEGHESLAVPTWFYGHEPTNQFADNVAKYFANSIREDGLLAIATRGVVFAPGSAGTTQEVFQDATQNHYAVFDKISPMVFLGREYWQEQLPAEPLLRRLAGDRAYAPLIGTVDTADEALDFLRRNPPIPAHR